jgi:hypoxanthine phosphoribosyltransferase
MPVDLLISPEALAARVTELGAEIRVDAGADTPVHLVGVLKGAFVFMADLMRAIDGPVSCDFVAMSSYGAGTTSSGTVKIVKDLDHPLAGRDVVIVEDIVDTGLTLEALRSTLQGRGPRSLRTVCLLDKPSRRRVDVALDYVGFSIDDLFVVGYGLDCNQMHRNLPYVGVLKEGD